MHAQRTECAQILADDNAALFTAAELATYRMPRRGPVRIAQVMCHAVTANGRPRLRELFIRWEMDLLACELLRAMAADPDCQRFAEREPLWMRREALRERLAYLRAVRS